MPLCFNIRCNPSLSWRTVPFYALIVQRLTSNWIIEETPREKPLSPKFNLPFDKNGDKKFFDPQEGVCSQKNGVIDGSWQEFLAQIFPLHCRLIPESFMLMCSKEKKEKTTHILWQNWHLPCPNFRFLIEWVEFLNLRTKRASALPKT